MKKKILYYFSALALITLALVSCKKPAPTAEIFGEIDGYTVTFNPVVEDASNYLWDFGDGTAGSIELNPVHTYESFGDYTVTLKVSGEGGEFIATKVITIEATSIKDLLTGGSKATAGKTWVLDQAYTVGDGGGPVQNPPYTIAIPSIDNVLTVFGLGAEYDNEFTFFFDGRYSVSAKNGNVLAAAVYGFATETIQGDPAWDIGLCAASWTAPVSATWTLKSESFTVDAVGDPNDPNNPPAHGNVTISGQDWIQISGGDAFFGILDWSTTTRRFIIDDITSNTMRVSMFVCGYSDNADYFDYPSNMFHLTYKKK